MIYNPNKVYIVFDGTSHYGVWGCDVEMEKTYNNVEVVKGPFFDWDDYVDDLIDQLNAEAWGRKFDTRYNVY